MGISTAVRGSVLLLLIIAVPCAASTLDRDFAHPPLSSRPGVWWRWIDGNVSKEGITRDLQEMARQGIRSAEIFDVAGAPQVGSAAMMGPLWRGLFHHAVTEAARDGIRLGVVPAAGWGTGGPWIGPDNAAKVLRYTETQVDGPQSVNRVLPAVSGSGGYHRDVAVVAFPEPPHRPMQPAAVAASSVLAGYCGEQNWPAADVVDGDPNTYWRSANAPTPESPVSITFHYPAPLTASGLYLAGRPGAGPGVCELQSSGDGRAFHSITRFTVAAGEPRRIAFAPVAATDFKLLISSAHSPDIQLAEAWVLRPGDRPNLHPGVKWWWFKSANRGFWDYPAGGPAVLDDEYPADASKDCSPHQVIDLTHVTTPDGHLRWKAPPGRWTIARFGSILLGEAPRVMSRALHGGYEADPFSPAAADRMFNQTTAVLADDSKAQTGKALAGILVDSWEYGASANGFQPTWTPAFRAEFQRRRGYDLLPWLPALARRIVGSRALTDRFLWDYRQTLSDLYLDFYARLTHRAHLRGLYSRAENGYGTYPFQHIDGLAAFARVDLPMGEFWFRDPVMTQHYPFADSVRTAASAAHIYGRRQVSAESLTVGHGIWHAPEDYKPDLDAAFCDGLNHSMLHLWSQQYDPTARPGLDTYDLINANMTWWNQSRAFLTYIARCQSLLQQGLPVADACYFVGEGTGKFVPGRAFVNPSLPAGYEFDGINAEVILTRLKCRDSRLILPDGMSYRYLVLPPSRGWRVTGLTLTKLAALVHAGATIIGPPPGGAPGLTDYTAQDQEIARLSRLLWGPRPAAVGARKVGQGRVVWGQSMQRLLAADSLPPDFDVVSGGPARAGLAGARWIWSARDGPNPPPGERSFRTTIQVPLTRKITSAQASVSADNTFDLAVNGTVLAHGSDWHQVINADIIGALHRGNNTIIIHAANTGDAPNPAGLIARLVITLDDGSTIVHSTGDGSWTILSTPPSASEGSRTNRGPAPAILGPLGMSPWGMIDTAVQPIGWTHRTTGAAEIYFLSNPNDGTDAVTCRFRVSGKLPEIFDPVTGDIRPAVAFNQARDFTLPLKFAPHQSLFIVFRKSIPTTAHGSAATNFPSLKPIQRLAGPWNVQFDPLWGGPKSALFPTLTPWNSRPEEGIRYYSGVATYRQQFNLTHPLPAGHRLYLSLGTVKDIAQISLNGKPLGIVWCAPWRLAIPASLLKPSGNHLEIQVANLWPNRLIGDARLPPERRLTRTNVTLPADTPLLDSGLLGPVILQSERH